MSGRLLHRASVRYLIRHPAQLALTVLGVGLGVAVVVAMDLAIQSSRTALDLSTRALAGEATHHVVGGPAGLPDSVFRTVRVDAGVRRSAPVVEGWASAPRLPGRALRLLGVDPFSERPFRRFLSEMADGGAGVDVLLTRPAVLMAASTALAAGLAAGDTVTLVVGGRTSVVTVAGVLEAEDASSREALSDLIVTDVALAQRLLDMEGRLSRIEVALAEEEAPQALDRLTALLPAGVRVQAAGERAEALAAMTAAFDLNLRALSLLGLVFGMFLVYNAVTFSVVQRRALLGRLRAVGVTPVRLLVQILGEAAALGALGSLLGVLAGVVLGRGLVRLVVRTVSDLYFAVSVESLALPPGVLLRGALLGILAAVVASLPPALEAAASAPRTALSRSAGEERWTRAVPAAAAGGAALAAAGAGLLWLSQGLGASFAALFAIVVGVALVVPLGMVVLLRAAVPPASALAGALGRYAARGVVAALSRTAPAVASLVVAVSVTVGLGVMIGSFRGTVERWLARTLQADVYVSAPSPVASRPEGTLDPADVARLVGAQSVEGASLYRSVVFPSEYGETRLVAVDLHPSGDAAYRWVEGEGASPLAALRGGGAAIVSEPFAFRHDVGVGSTLRLPSPQGERELEVAGVFYDYGSDRGVVMMSLAAYRSIWGDSAVTSMGLFLRPGVDAGAAAEALRARLTGASPVLVRSNRDLREGSLAVFDRTFEITRVLRLLALVVAFVGVVGALMALQLERGRELAVLRASGVTPAQVWLLVTAQTGLMGLSAGLLSLPLGALLALLMTHVVNRRSFGWTLELAFPPGVLIQALMLSLGAALLAGVYPAVRMSRTPPAAALRGE